MSSEFENNLFGKLYIIEVNKKASYNFAYIDKYVNIICNDPEDLYEIVKKQHWINAVSTDNKQIVFSVGDAKFILGDINILQFKSPVIIYGNIKIDRSSILTFNQLYFSGELVNDIYPASKIIELKKDKNISLEFKNNEEVDLKKKYKNKFVLIATIGGPIYWEYGKIYDIAKTITSKIKFEFVRTQRIDNILNFAKIFYNVMVLLCGRNNIDFDIGIRVKSTAGKKKLLNEYRVFVDNGYNEKFSSVANIDSIMKIEKIWEHIDGLLDLFINDKNKPILSYLIDNNSNRCNGYNIINVCNSIENEFDIKVINDSIFNEYAEQYIKQIKRKGFSNKNRVEHIKILKAKKNLDKFFIRIKIEIIFKYYYKYIINLNNELKFSFCRYVAPNMFLYILPKFLEIRNSAAHKEVQWGDGKYLYNYVDLLIYFCIFERAGYDVKTVMFEIGKLHL